MPRNDSDIAKSVREVMEKKGVEIRLNVRTQSIHDTHDGVTLTYSDTSDGTPYFVDGDAILIATGRKPMIEGLNLQAAGVEVHVLYRCSGTDQYGCNGYEDGTDFYVPA